MYVEHDSKNYNGRVKDLKFQNKEVPCPAVPESGHKCLVFLLDLYYMRLQLYNLTQVPFGKVERH